MTNFYEIIKVLIPKPGLIPLDYMISKKVHIKVGDLIIVPFRKKNVIGIVWNKNCSNTCGKKLKIIDSNLNIIDSKHINIGIVNITLIQKASNYYLVPLGSIAKLVIPFDIESKLVKTKNQEVYFKYVLPNLSKEQINAINFIKAAKTTTLLKGVTGSGKTEVYFHLLAETIKNQKQSLLMLPEISLSLQMIRRFSERFGFEPTVWNSSVSKALKKNYLHNILTGSTNIIIGTRSSLFLPYKNLDLIIVDEEHDNSYKQEEGILYNARDMAVLKGYLLGIKVILVSATPSIETIYNVKQGKYLMVELKSRFGEISMPTVEIINMRNIKLLQDNTLSPILVEAINSTLMERKQCLLFLNRRGYAPLMLCKACGYRFHCRKCSTSMVVHKGKKLMECHYCGSTTQIYYICPECYKSNSLILYGQGVEKLEEEIKRLFPESKIQVISKDQSKKIDQIKNILQEMEIGNIDILIGTQIVTKGYNFPKLSLVGVVDADLGFLGGDLRCVEKTFQLLHQVGGRAGRNKTTKGKVLLQTYFPENKALIALVKGQEEEFIEMEVSHRKEAKMPPFTKMAVISIVGKNQERTLSIANYIVQQAPISSAKILGPAEALIFKLSGRYRYRILIICERNFNIQKYLSLWLRNCKIARTFQIKIDIDPYNFF